MNGLASNPVVLLAVWLLGMPAVRAGDERAAMREALAALQHGDFAAAERTLRAEVETHPNDAGALTLLGVALDNLGKLPEADQVHRRAVANAPRSSRRTDCIG